MSLPIKTKFDQIRKEKKIFHLENKKYKKISDLENCSKIWKKIVFYPSVINQRVSFFCYHFFFLAKRKMFFEEEDPIFD